MFDILFYIKIVQSVSVRDLFEGATDIMLSSSRFEWVIKD